MLCSSGGNKKILHAIDYVTNVVHNLVTSMKGNRNKVTNILWQNDPFVQNLTFTKLFTSIINFMLIAGKSGEH